MIIKKMPFGEADFLVRVFTKDFGKIDILAKGARKTASKLNLHLDILNHIRLQFVKPASTSASLGGNSERLPTLMDAETLARFDDWFSDAERLSIAGRILQVLDMAIMAGAQDEKLFFMILDFFGKAKNEKVALEFLRDFFKHEGYGDALPLELEERIINLWPALKN